MENIVKLERQVKEIYDSVLRPLGEKYHFKIPLHLEEAPRLPTVLFLGNHSSGKSSFINYLTESKLQKTGLAPTDDGFTIITYGEVSEEADGQTAVTHPDLAFTSLRELGPQFLSRLRLKAHPHELLKQVMLVDSPGMIDASASGNSRGYDYAGAVRAFAERADLILFFFDPDKPGTTGETLNVFTEILGGLQHKLMILMHKVDQFQSMRDFARTYGTLCWNLAKIIKSKDIPHIFNTYLPGVRTPDSNSLPLEDFDVSLDEIIAQIHRAPTRRLDNLVSDLYTTTNQLLVHLKVVQCIARDYLKRRSFAALATILPVVAGGGGATYFWRQEDLETAAILAGSGIGLGALVFFISRYLLQRFRQRLRTVDALNPFFEQAFHLELSRKERPDLRGWWESVRTETLHSLSTLGVANIPLGIRTLGQFRKLEKIISDQVPTLRRTLTTYHRSLRTVPDEKQARKERRKAKRQQKEASRTETAVEPVLENIEVKNQVD